ncbi:unnamed protein product [Rotaria sordida]|uniref:AAA+ ATPase domain-containing protein n=1 Tax=Rotaria sordida TaxID=392033 RepID=A0A818QSQ2_9BILA|nr:unnamed protein product [Rotaria sordida]
MEELNADIANRGEFEKRLKLFLKQIRTANGGIIVFIDNIHLILGGEGVNDAANLLKFMLSEHEICCTGATTLDEYDKHFEQDPADPVLKKHFQEVFIEELTVAESVSILRDGLKRSMESHIRFPILDSAIVSAVELSSHFIIYKCLPYEAIDTIYRACRNIFRARMDSSSNIIDRSKHEELSSDVTETTSLKEKEDTATKDDTSEIDLTEVKEESKPFTLKHEIPKGVDSTVIIDIFSKLTDIPVSTLTKAENNRLSIIREDLHNRFIDQDAAIDTVVETILRNRAEFPVKNQPLASFLFCGPIGVGKKTLARAVALALYYSEQSIYTIDMSKYTEANSIYKLINIPREEHKVDPEQNKLIKIIQQKPYAIILFDQIEKVHHEFWNILLRYLDNDNKINKEADFTNTIFFFISNINEEIDLHFRKEFFDCLNNIIYFQSPTMDRLCSMIHFRLKLIEKIYKKQNFTIILTWKALDSCLKYYDQVRHINLLKTYVNEQILNPLLDSLSLMKHISNTKVVIDINDENEYQVQFG